MAKVAARGEMQHKLREKYLASGADIDVIVSGKFNERIELRYSAIDASWKREVRSSGVLDELQTMGFKRLVLSNGRGFRAAFTLRPEP